MGVDEVETVMDKMVEIGNHFPVSTQELAEGMTNAGSTLKVAGNDINQSIALLTAANTSMQDISKSSTGLRTIAARLRRSETELNELGETVTTAKYQQMVDMLTKHSVSLVDENGELRDTYSIIQDIAAAWGDMSKNEQAALAEMAAGTRQQNVFTSLLLNFKEAQKAMTAMETSTGSLTSAYDIYLESIQAHTGMFKAAFQELAQSVFDSDMITDAIDIGTQIVSALNPIATTINNITDAVGGLNGVLSILAGAIVLKNITKISGSIYNVSKGVTHLGEVAKNFVSSLAIMRETEFGPPEMILSGGAVVGIGAAIAAVTAYIAIVQKYKKAQEELRESAYDNSKAESNRLGTFEEIRDRYEELGELASKGELGEDGFREIASLQSQISANQGEINSLIAGQAGQIDLVNGKYSEQLGLLDTLVGKQAELTANRAGQAADIALADYFNAYGQSVENDDSVLRAINGRIDYISKKLGRDIGGALTIGEGDDAYQVNFTKWLKASTHDAGELSDVLLNMYKDLSSNNDWQDIVDARYGSNYHIQLLNDIWSEYETYSSKVKDVKDRVNELSEALIAQREAASEVDPSKFAADDFASFNAYRNDLIDAALSDDRVLKALNEGIIDANGLASQIDSVLASVAPNAFDGYKKAIGEAGESTLKDIVNEMPRMVGNSGTLADLNDVADNITKLYGWLDKINSGDFDSKDLFDMLEEFPNLQSAADGVDNLTTDLWKLGDAVQNAINAAPNGLIKRIDDYMDSHILSENVKAQMETWKEYLRGMTDLTNVSLPEKVAKIKEMQSAIYDAAGDTSGVSLEQYNNLIKLNSKFADAIELDGERVIVNTEKAMKVVREMGTEYIEVINEQIAADRQRLEALNALERTRGELTAEEASERASLEQSIQRYQTLRGEILNTLSAYEQWRAAQGTANAGSEVDELREAWEHLNKVTKGGKDKDALFGQWNTDDTRAALALLGKDIDDFVNNGVFDNKKAQTWLSNLNKYLNNGKQGVDDFLLAIRDAGMATYENGLFQILDGTTLGDIADALGTSEEVVRAMLELSTRYHDMDFSYIIEEYEKEKKAIEDVNLAKEAEARTQESYAKLDTVEKENKGVSSLLDLYDQLRQAESQRAQAQSLGAGGLVESMDQQIQTIRDNITEVLSEPLDMASIDAVREAINNTIQSLKQEMDTKKELGIEFDEAAIQAQIDALTQDLSDIEAVVQVKAAEDSEAELDALETTATLIGQKIAEALAGSLDEEHEIKVNDSQVVQLIADATTANAQLDKLSAQRTVTILQKVADYGKIKVGEDGSAGAYGGAFAKGGSTLVGELGQEMVVDPEGHYWYTVGDNGPEFIKLPKHAIVFNHKQTKSLLSNGKTGERGKALASGSAYADVHKVNEDLINAAILGFAIGTGANTTKVTGGGKAKLTKSNGKNKGKGGSGGGGGGGSGSGSGSSKKSSDKDNWFIKQYKENNHLIKMDKKEQKDYLNWLDGAYKKAYKQGIIDLDDYYKYQKWYTFCASSSQRIPSNCWDTPKIVTPQRKDETHLSVMVAKAEKSHDMAHG